MADTDLVKSGISVMVVVSAAVRNLTLYDKTATAAVNAIAKVHQAATEFIGESGSLVFLESRGKVAIEGLHLSDRDQKSPQVSAFADLISGAGIAKLEFKKGVTIEDITEFLDALSQKPEEVDEALQLVVSENRCPNLGLVIGGSAGGEDGQFQAGDALKEVFIPVIRIIEDVVGEEQKKIVSQKVAALFSEKDDDFLLSALSQIAATEMGREIFGHIVGGMDDARFEKAVSGIKQMAETASGDDSDTVKQAYREMMQSEKGAHMLKAVKEREAAEKDRKAKERAHLTAGLNSIIKGGTEYFGDSAVMEALPRTIDTLIEKGKQDAVRAIVNRMGDALVGEDASARLESANTLPVIIGKFEDEEQSEIIGGLSQNMVDWVKLETKAGPGMAAIAGYLGAIARNMIKGGEYPQCNYLIEPFNLICSGKSPKNAEITEAAGNCLREIGTDEILTRLVEEFKTNANKRRKDAIETLVQLGEAATEKLLDLLKTSEDRFERSRALQVVTDIGSPAVPPILEQLELGKPWYYMRNLVLLLGKVGNESHLETIVPFLKYNDVRVCQEAVTGIYNIGEDEREDILIEALRDADDQLKPDIVRNLGALEAEEAVPLLLELFENKSKFRNDIAHSACVALGRIGSLEAIPVLSEALEEKKKGLMSAKPFDDKVKQAAAHALEMISQNQGKPKKKKKKKKKKRTKEGADAAMTDAEKQAADEELANREKEADALAEKGDKDAAFKLYLELIAGQASKQDFEKADALKDKMAEIDSMALTEIYKAEEIIEKEKAKFIDEDYLKQWDVIYGQLSPDETNALFYAMKPESFEPDGTVFSQGELSSRLYFIDDGEFRLTYTLGEDEIEICTLGSGKIAGSDTFFSHTVSTSSMSAATGAALHYIEKSVMGKWKESLPALEAKLRDICMKQEKTSAIVGENGLDRRANKRVNLSGGFVAKIFDDSGAPTGNPVKGDLATLSAGGLSFLSKIPKDAVADLMNRNLRMVFNLPTKKGPQKMDMTGRIVAIHYRMENDFSVHVKFDKKLSQLKG